MKALIGLGVAREELGEVLAVYIGGGPALI
jgi:hypothetical protein